MPRPHWLQVLRSLGLEFWLLLPLLGLVFWISSGFLTNRLLNRSYTPTDALALDKRHDRQAIQTVQTIRVVVSNTKGISQVSVQLNSPSLKELRFEFPVTEPEAIEAATSQELGVPLDRVKELIRYERAD